MSESYDDAILAGNAGIALKSEGITWKTLAASLSYAAGLYLVQVTAFLIVRPRIPKIYRPRTYLIHQDQCLPEPAAGTFAWVRSCWAVSNKQILQRCGPDALLFLRYIQLILKIFLPSTMIIVPLLTPINSRSGGLSNGALKSLTISNVDPVYTSTRLWAHWALSVYVIGWTCYLIHGEVLYYVKMKQEYLSNRERCFNTSCKTILVGNIPKALLESEKLREIFGVFYGGVDGVYINTDSSGLSKTIEQRKETLSKIERSYTRLITRCVRRAMKDTDCGVRQELQRSIQSRTNGDRIGETTKINRETMRLPLPVCSSLPGLLYLGKKVDRIQYLLEKLDRLNQQVHTFQASIGTSTPTGSAFIRFRHQIAAHLACQSIIHGAPYRMTPRIPEVRPEDIIWSNIALNWRQRWLRTIAGVAISCSLIVFYAVPIGLTSFLANLDTLASNVTWLSWLSAWPTKLKSVVQGVLSPALLQLLLLLIPSIYRVIVQFQGAPTSICREVAVQKWHFLFLFVQVFLVVTISGSLISFVTSAANSPRSVSEELAQTLPKAANYFLSYVLVKALSGSGSALLQPWTLIVHYISPLLDVTPRERWQRQAQLASVEWARLYPPLTSIAVIGLAFSVVAPIVLCFVSLAFILYWSAYRYNILYVYQHSFDSGGRFFVLGIKQLFLGLYILELCLIGTFFLAKGSQAQASCTPQALAMIAVMLLTIAYHYFLGHAFGTLTTHLPILGNIGIGTNDSAKSLLSQLHGAMSAPTIWVPRDSMGFSTQERLYAKLLARSIDMSDDGAFLGNNEVIRLEACPPEKR